MKLEKLFLTKDELPILYKTCFQIPIHPKLLEENIKIRKEIAHEVFPRAAEDWYNDLSDYVKNVEEKQTKEWIENVFLKNKPEIEKFNGRQNILGCWSDDIMTKENGFARCLSISRDGGGTLYFNKGDSNCEAFSGIYINFPKDKIEEFKINNTSEFDLFYSYAQHNIDHYPGALFLRNWAIIYMNEVFKEIF